MFFAGDSAGHCLPLTAEGIRTAFYFGIALGRELRAVLEGRQDRAQALERYHAFSGSHRWKYESIYLAQQSIRHLHGRPLDTLTRVLHAPARGELGLPALPRHRAAAVRDPGAARPRRGGRRGKSPRSGYSNSLR